MTQRIPDSIAAHPLIVAIMAAFPGSEITMTKPPTHYASPEIPAHFELEAIEAASEPAGVYIEQLGKTDMATWTKEEWYRFLEIVILAAQAKISQKLLDDEIPF